MLDRDGGALDRDATTYGGARVRGSFGRLIRSPELAAVLAILVPGLGHARAGRFRAAAAWWLAIVLGYWLVFFPGVVLHALSVWSAYRAAAAAPGDGPRARGTRGLVRPEDGRYKAKSGS
jgi:hypothetical protein